MTNGPTWTNGQLGGALSFDGVHDYVGVGNIAALKFTSEDFSYGGWLYHNGAFATPEHPIGKGSPQVFSPYSFWVNSGTLKILVGASGCGSWLTTTNLTSAVSNATWEHYFFTKSGSVITLYKNGVSIGSFTMASSTICDNTASFRLGDDFLTGKPWSGLIDDVRVYSRALSAADVAALYASSAVCASPAAQEGTFLYNGDYHVLQYCDGVTWRGIGK